MPTLTANLGLAKPNNLEGNYGPAVNANFDSIDTLLHGVIDKPLGAAAINSYSATPVFDLSSKSIQYIKLTGNVASSTATGARDGIYLFVVEQDNIGGRAFAFPANFKNAGQINPAAQDTAAGTVGVQAFLYISALNTFYAFTPLFYA
jgi:hypothetical protein